MNTAWPSSTSFASLSCRMGGVVSVVFEDPERGILWAGPVMGAEFPEEAKGVDAGIVAVAPV